jgi:hypothetical protein
MTYVSKGLYTITYDFGGGANYEQRIKQKRPCKSLLRHI